MAKTQTWSPSGEGSAAAQDVALQVNDLTSLSSVPGEPRLIAGLCCHCMKWQEVTSSRSMFCGHWFPPHTHRPPPLSPALNFKAALGFFWTERLLAEA